MTKRAIFTNAELKRMADLANSEGVVVELEREGSIIRVMPFRSSHVIRPKASREREAETALVEWLASQEHK